MRNKYNHNDNTTKKSYWSSQRIILFNNLDHKRGFKLRRQGGKGNARAQNNT